MCLANEMPPRSPMRSSASQQFSATSRIEEQTEQVGWWVGTNSYWAK